MSFLYFDVTQEMISKAEEIRRDRDEKYGNIYEEVDTDLRWVGDLGEICFNSWLKHQGMKEFGWHIDNAAGKPDFTLFNKRIDIKTVKRKVPPRSSYTAQITASHQNSPVDELFFCSYEYQINRMWFLGGISKTDFIKKAVYYKAGDKVHSNYTIRQGHEIFNAPINILLDPNAWLQGVFV